MLTATAAIAATPQTPVTKTEKPVAHKTTAKTEHATRTGTRETKAHISTKARHGAALKPEAKKEEVTKKEATKPEAQQKEMKKARPAK